ncbi:Hypothetical_protein [Hexamita inflata]|uniref:Hypothetical_protein n=1 Tax=Hexamita inflata TaxID=28002 RepID=A0ABP1HPF8_9EUKA
MRSGQISCGRQNPPIQSAELAGGIAKGMPSTSLQDWKAVAPLLRNADGTTQVIPVQIELHEAAALRPGCCTRDVGCLYIYNKYRTWLQQRCPSIIVSYILLVIDPHFICLAQQFNSNLPVRVNTYRQSITITEEFRFHCEWKTMKVAPFLKRLDDYRINSTSLNVRKDT